MNLKEFEKWRSTCPEQYRDSITLKPVGEIFESKLPKDFNYLPVNIKELVPKYAIHAGEVLKDELRARKISQIKFCKDYKFNKTILNEIINGSRSISAKTAIKLESALGIDAMYWMNLQANYELDKERIKQKSTMNLKEEFTKTFDNNKYLYSELISANEQIAIRYTIEVLERINQYNNVSGALEDELKELKSKLK